MPIQVGGLEVSCKTPGQGWDLPLSVKVISALALPWSEFPSAFVPSHLTHSLEVLLCARHCGKHQDTQRSERPGFPGVCFGQRMEILGILGGSRENNASPDTNKAILESGKWTGNVNHPTCQMDSSPSLWVQLRSPVFGHLPNVSSGQPPAPPGSWSFPDSPAIAPVVVVGGGACTSLLLRPFLPLQGTDLLGDREGVRLRARQGRQGGKEGVVSDERSRPSLCSPSLQDTCLAGWEVTVHSGLGLWE